MAYKSAIFLLLIVIGCSCTDMPKCGRSNIPLVTNYDGLKMKGAWYVVEVGNEHKSKKKCMGGIFTTEKRISNGSIIVKEIGTRNGKPDNMDISLTQVESKSQYIAQCKEYPPAVASVVGTDYKSYANWFVCKDGHHQGGLLFVSARDRYPSEETMKKAHNSLKESGFETGKSDLFTVDQSNC